MWKFFLLIFCVIFSNPASAEDYVERMIREKREAAERKRMETMQRIQHTQSNPEAAFAVRVAPTEKAEKFKIARDGHFYVPAKINDKSINFMADTGATSIFISQQTARSVGISIYNLNYNRKYVTANGATGSAAIANARTFKVGDIILYDVPVTVSQEKDHISLLGMEFFNRVSEYGVKDGVLTIKQ